MSERWTSSEGAASHRRPVTHIPYGAKGGKFAPLPKTRSQGGKRDWVTACISRAGRRRMTHEFDLDSRCIFCDKEQQ